MGSQVSPPPIAKRYLTLLLITTLAIGIFALVRNTLTSFSSQAIVRLAVGDERVRKDGSAVGSVLATRWIVVTTISKPTPQILKLSQLPGWQLLVVADQKTPVDWSTPNVLLLDVQGQAQLGYQIIDHLPWNSYARKMVGYPYAIQHGAQMIYDTDDDNAPNGNGSHFEEAFEVNGKVQMGGLVVQAEAESSVKNPYVHFGGHSIWPRGYPLDEIRRNYTPSYTVCKSTPPVIQQGLVSGDPDVDAILRLTRKKAYAPLNIQFDTRAPPVVYPPGLFAPINSQNTVFLYEAFWALILPVSVPCRVTDIWRGYWAQPLLWRTGNVLGFFAPGTTQVRNPHNYLSDFGEEIQLFTQSGALIHLLREWTCAEDTLYYCMEALTDVMVAAGFLGQQDSSLMSAWIHDLRGIGYRAPRLKEPIQGSPCIPGFPKTNSTFQPVRPGDGRQVSVRRWKKLLRYCDLDRPKPRATASHPSTLLVVTFNGPHYDNVELLDLLYRPYFPNILYCGDLLTDVTSSLLSSLQKVSSIHADVLDGFFSYECALWAIDMNYGVDNYVVLSDDVLFNFWTPKYDPAELWMHALPSFEALRPYSTEETSNFTDQWWHSKMGRPAFKAFMTDLSKMSDLKDGFMRTRETHGLNATTAVKESSDIIFIPKYKAEVFSRLGWAARRRNLFLEFAVPLLVQGLSAADKYGAMKVLDLWGQDRYQIWKFYNRTTVDALHPLKMSDLTNITIRWDWCENYVSNLPIY